MGFITEILFSGPVASIARTVCKSASVLSAGWMGLLLVKPSSKIESELEMMGWGKS